MIPGTSAAWLEGPPRMPVTPSAGASGTRHSPRPLIAEGERIQEQLGRRASRQREAMTNRSKRLHHTDLADIFQRVGWVELFAKPIIVGNKQVMGIASRPDNCPASSLHPSTGYFAWGCFRHFGDESVRPRPAVPAYFTTPISRKYFSTPGWISSGLSAAATVFAAVVSQACGNFAQSAASAPCSVRARWEATPLHAPHRRPPAEVDAKESVRVGPPPMPRLLHFARTWRLHPTTTGNTLQCRDRGDHDLLPELT